MTPAGLHLKEPVRAGSPYPRAPPLVITGLLEISDYGHFLFIHTFLVCLLLREGKARKARELSYFPFGFHWVLRKIFVS